MVMVVMVRIVLVVMMMSTDGYTWVCLHSGLSTKSQPEEAEHSAFSQNPLEVLNVTITNREIGGKTTKYQSTKKSDIDLLEKAYSPFMILVMVMMLVVMMIMQGQTLKR